MHIHEIHKLFPVNAYFTYISYRQIGGYDMRPFDCVILTWSSTHTYAYKAFWQEVHVIQNINKPVIWICLGCELIASAYHCTIAKHSERIQWDIKIMCANDAKEHLVHEAHKFSITDLWTDIEWLAKSDYWYEIIKHKSKPIIWFQFHPEVITNSNDGLMLFKKYVEMLQIWKIQ